MWTIGIRKDVYEASGAEFKWPEGKFASDKAQLEKMVAESSDPGAEISGIPSNGCRLEEEDVDRVAAVYGRTVVESLSGTNVHSVYGPLWTVRTDGMGGLINVPGDGRAHRVRPLSAKECTLVQGLPSDYYETMQKLGMSDRVITKAAAMGWPIRTGCSVIEQVMNVVREYYEKTTDGKSPKCLTERAI